MQTFKKKKPDKFCRKDLTLFFMSILILVSTSLCAENFSFLQKTFLILPESSSVKIRWILKPDVRNNLQDMRKEKINFFIDFKNEPVIVYENKMLFNPLKGYFLKLNPLVKDIICLDTGVLILSDGEYIGHLEIEKSKEFIPAASIKPISKLPIYNAKLFKGEDTVYAFAFNSETKLYEVYLFDKSKRLFKKIASFNESMKALTGRGEKIFLANGRMIYEYKNGNLKVLYIHPREEIEEISYNEKTGLIYITSKGVGLVKNNSSLEFLQTENPQVFLKNTNLYVFFGSVSGLLEIMNIDDLKNYSFNVEKIIDIQQTL